MEITQPNSNPDDALNEDQPLNLQEKPTFIYNKKLIGVVSVVLLISFAFLIKNSLVTQTLPDDQVVLTESNNIKEADFERDTNNTDESCKYKIYEYQTNLDLSKSITVDIPTKQTILFSMGDVPYLKYLLNKKSIVGLTYYQEKNLIAYAENIQNANYDSLDFEIHLYDVVQKIDKKIISDSAQNLRAQNDSISGFSFSDDGN